MSDATFLDWPFLDESHRAFAASLEDWANTILPGLCPEDEAHGPAMDQTARRLVTALGQAGFLKAAIPAAYGGRAKDFDVRALCLGREILARHAGLADFAFAMQGLGSAAITLFGNEAQQARYLPKVGTGESIAAFAISEADAGSDVGAMTTRAVLDGEHYVINGAKTWISNAGLADFYTVFAHVGDVPGAKNLVAFVVDATLREGMAQGRFADTPIGLAQGIVVGTLLGALHGGAEQVQALPTPSMTIGAVLRGLGVPADEAALLAARPLPLTEADMAPALQRLFGT